MDLRTYKGISRAVSADISQALAKYGLKVDGVSASINETCGSVRLTVKAADTNMKAADGSATTPEAERYKQLAEYCGLKADWLNQSFSIGSGRRLKVLGLRDGRSKKSVLVEVDGSRRVCAPDYLRLVARAPL